MERLDPLFSEGDSVLCYEPMLGRARALYEAKVTGVVKRRTRQPTYRLKLFDWNKIYKDRTKKCSYDQDVPESFLCKVNERRRALMNKITKVANETDDNDERMKVVSEILLKALNVKKIKQLPPGIDLGENRLDSPEDNLTLNEVKEAESEYHVEIELHDELKKILEHDCLLVKNKNKMSTTNGPSVAETLEAFLCYHANTLLFDKPKHLKDSYKVEHRISLTKEVLEGIRCLFDIILTTNLLYKEEQQVYDIIMSGNEPPLYQETAGPVSRRQTRSSAAETPQWEIPAPFGQYSTNEVFKTSAATQQLLSKLEQHNDSLSEGPPSTKKPRLSAHLQPNIQNSPSGRSTPTQNLQAEALMKEVNEWRLVPQDVPDTEKAKLPSFKYGAVYLLRLFVQLPEILTRMKLADEWRSFLLGVFHYLLSYLVEERVSLFDSHPYMSITSPLKDSSKC